MEFLSFFDEFNKNIFVDTLIMCKVGNIMKVSKRAKRNDKNEESRIRSIESAYKDMFLRPRRWKMAFEV
jgi:hypothetical protein